MSTSWSRNLPEKPIHSITDFEFVHDPDDRNAKLGIGSFATVKLAKDKKSNKLHALKLISIHPSKATASDLHNLRIEITIHRKLDHPNIIKYYEYFQHGDIVYLVLDYAENAIQHMHKNNFMHRDLKPENLLLDKNYNIKLCDFGWAAQNIYDKRTTFCGTYEYMAPEIVHKQSYNYTVDIWSLGILLFELLHKDPPFKGRNITEITKSMQNPTINFGNNINPEAKDLIFNILKFKPEERYSIEQILNHSWIRKHIQEEESNSSCIVSPKTNKKLNYPNKTLFTSTIIDKIEPLTLSEQLSSPNQDSKILKSKPIENKKIGSIDVMLEDTIEKDTPKPIKSPSYDNANHLIKGKENVREYAAMQMSGSLHSMSKENHSNILRSQVISPVRTKNHEDYSSSAVLVSKYTKMSHLQNRDKLMELDNERKFEDQERYGSSAFLSPMLKHKIDKMVPNLASENTTPVKENFQSLKFIQNKKNGVVDNMLDSNLDDNKTKVSTDGSYITMTQQSLSPNYLKKVEKVEKDFTKEIFNFYRDNSIENKGFQYRKNIQTTNKEESQNENKFIANDNFFSPKSKSSIGLLNLNGLATINDRPVISLTEADENSLTTTTRVSKLMKIKTQTSQDLLKGGLNGILNMPSLTTSNRLESQGDRLHDLNLREMDINRILTSRNGAKYELAKSPSNENNSNVKLTLKNFSKGFETSKKSYYKPFDKEIATLNILRSVDRHRVVANENESYNTLSNWGSFLHKKPTQIISDILNVKLEESKAFNSKFMERILNQQVKKCSIYQNILKNHKNYSNSL